MLINFGVIKLNDKLVETRKKFNSKKFRKKAYKASNHKLITDIEFGETKKDFDLYCSSEETINQLLFEIS